MRPARHRFGRRPFVQGGLGLGGLALLAGCGLLQGGRPSEKIARVGYLHTGNGGYIEEFLAGMRDLGYVEGKNFTLEVRVAEGEIDRLPGLAAELVRLGVDVIATHAQGVPAARNATTSIPIVMLVFADAVAAGLIDSIAHPGGNVTGSTAFNAEIMAKRLELLKAVVPATTRAAVLLNATYPLNAFFLEAMKTTASALNVAIEPFEVRTRDELEGAFAAMVGRSVGGIVLHDDPLFVFNRNVVARLVEGHRLAAVGFLEAARAGGLMAYGVDFVEMYRRGAYFVDRILRGANPAELPVERPTHFDLVVNLKAARTLGVTLPPDLLQQATEVIE